MRKELGKIKSIDIEDYDGHFGLVVELGGQSWGVTSFTYAADPELMNKIKSYFKDAKVNKLQKLAGKPVEVTFEGNALSSWRILTEVV